MRPIKLKLQAIGPFAKYQEIDFQRLTNGNIFIISGKTGSGKSTIFDAIMYALFDSPSIESRDKESLRSDFASPEVESFVELTFISQQKKYRVKRMPKQYRIKKRGTGLKLDETKVELYVDEECISTKVNEVNKKLIEILGINAKQFRQIIMLAQGEFKKLLVADSKEREEIFRKIFQTENYLILQDKLKAKTNELRKEINTTEIKLATIFKQEEIEYDNVNADEALQNLHTKQKNVEVNIEELNQQIKLSKLKIDEMEINNQNMEKINSLHQKLQENQEKNNKLKKDVVKINDLSLELEKVKKYQNISSAYFKVQEYSKNKLNIEQNIEKNQSLAIQIEKLENEVLNSKKVDELETLIKNNSEEIIKIDKKQEKNQEKLSKIKQLEHFEQEMYQNTSKINDLRNELRLSEEVLKNYKQSLDEVSLIKLKIKDNEIILNELNEQKQLIETKQNLLKRIQQSEQNFQLCLNDFRQEKNKFNQNEEVFYLNQASILAMNLKQGDLCPVCGSTEHPNLAKTNLEIIITKEDLDLQKQNIEQLRIGVDKKSQKTSNLKTELQAIQNQINLQPEYVKAQEVEINYLLNKLREELRSAENFILENQNIEDEMNKIKLNESELEKKINLMQGKIDGLNVENQDTDVLTQDIEVLNTKLNDLNKNSKLYHEKLKINSEQREVLVKLEATYETTKIKLEQELFSVDLLLKQEQANLQQYLDENELSGNLIEDYLKVDSLELQKQISNYQYEVKQVSQNIFDLQQDISKLEQITKFSNFEKIEEYKINHSKLLETLGSNRKELANINNSIKQVKMLLSENSVQLSQYQIYANLERVACGQNEHYLSFERYILAIYFDEIIKYANLRLKRLTDNRYSFKRNSEKVKGQRQRGLDLVIYDFYTAHERDVTTLSGGESFKASIALALGLSDAMRIENGGIELETLFIDEGFGTLDEESLEMAIDVLNDLQSDGRLIGVISHVNSLKERINQQILVEKSNVGSQVKLQIN